MGSERGREAGAISKCQKKFWGFPSNLLTKYEIKSQDIKRNNYTPSISRFFFQETQIIVFRDLISELFCILDPLMKCEWKKEPLVVV